jgi:glycosyltransferase involved in cell wall biosynthesis
MSPFKQPGGFSIDARIILHSASMSERGESTNAIALYQALKEFYGVDCLIVFPSNSKANNTNRIKEIKSMQLNHMSYNKKADLHRIGKEFGASHSYFYESGLYSELWIKNTKRISHAVFDYYEPFGDYYSYISSWLLDTAIQHKNDRTNKFKYAFKKKINRSPYYINPGMEATYVPLCAYSKEGDSITFRNKYKIPRSSRIIGRIGGFNQFDDLNAQKAVVDLLINPEYFFCFVNTRKFIEHPRIKYIDYLSTDEKWDFYSACDIFLNGRTQGESFGFSIVEPLMIGKPVIAPDLSINEAMDQNHIKVLGEEKYLYKNSNDLISKIKLFFESPPPAAAFTNKVVEFSPEKVADKFYLTFLS